MTPGDAARVLAKAAAFDQRTIGEADVMAWCEALPDVDGADALVAVSRHYTETDQRIMPVHVRRIAEQIGRERRRVIREAEERKAIAAYAAEAGPLKDRSADVRELVDQVRTVIPEGDREALRPRTVAWEREHTAYQRQQNAVPNPEYDSSMRPVPEWNAGKDKPAGCWWEDDAARERHAKVLLAESGRLAGRKPAHEGSTRQDRPSTRGDERCVTTATTTTARSRAGSASCSPTATRSTARSSHPAAASSTTPTAG